MRQLIFSLLISFVLVNNAWTAQKFPPLTPGMAYPEVLASWGEPIDRQEHEAKRQDIWIYKGDIKVVFSQGKVVAWTGQPQVESQAGESEVLDESSGKPARDSADSKSVDDLLTEILKDVPSADDAPGSGGSNPAPMAGFVAPPPPVAVAPGDDD